MFCNNSGAFTTTFKTSGGTGIVVAQGKRALLLADGTNVVAGRPMSKPMEGWEMTSDLKIPGNDVDRRQCNREHEEDMRHRLDRIEDLLTCTKEALTRHIAEEATLKPALEELITLWKGSKILFPILAALSVAAAGAFHGSRNMCAGDNCMNMPEKVVIGDAELWHGDCREVLPMVTADACLTDPKG